MSNNKSDPIEHVRVREKRLIGDPNVLTPHEVRTFCKVCIESGSAVGLLLIAVLLTGRSVDYWLGPDASLSDQQSQPINFALFE